MATEFRHFNDLPEELQFIVYDYLVQQGGDLHVCVRPRYADDGSLDSFEFHNEESYGEPGRVEGIHMPTTLNLLVVSQQMSFEAKKRLFGKNGFAFPLYTGEEELRQARRSLKWNLPVEVCVYAKKVSFFVHGTIWKDRAHFNAARNVLSTVATAFAGHDPDEPDQMLFTQPLPPLDSAHIYFDNEVNKEALNNITPSVLYFFEPLLALSSRRVKSLVLHRDDYDDKIRNLDRLLNIEGATEAMRKLRRVLKEGLKLEKVKDRKAPPPGCYEPIYDWSKVKPLVG